VRVSAASGNTEVEVVNPALVDPWIFGITSMFGIERNRRDSDDVGELEPIASIHLDVALVFFETDEQTRDNRLKMSQVVVHGALRLRDISTDSGYHFRIGCPSKTVFFLVKVLNLPLMVAVRRVDHGKEFVGKVGRDDF